MTSFIVTYDLIAPNKDYDSLYEKLKSYTYWAKINESCWFLKSNKTSAEVRDDLASVMDSNDKLFVATLSGVAAWRNLPDKVSKYLKDNL